MNETFGFFDVDCREITPTQTLAFRPRVQPLADKLNALYAYAARQDVVTIFTTCCSGRMLARDSRDDVLFVPLDASDTEWMQGATQAHLIYLQKKAYGDPQLNFACRAFDMFTDNQQAERLLRLLAIPEWVVFGNGFDLCVNSAATGILHAGYRVTLLTDLMIPGAKGYGNNGTEENKIAVYAELVRQGARAITSEQFFQVKSQEESLF